MAQAMPQNIPERNSYLKAFAGNVIKTGQSQGFEVDSG